MKRKAACIIMAFIFCMGLAVPVLAVQQGQQGTIPPAPNLHTASSWARDYISLAVYMGLVPEELQNNYTAQTTRAEFAALAVALYERELGEIRGRVNFTDTDDINVRKMASLET